MPLKWLQAWRAAAALYFLYYTVVLLPYFPMLLGGELYPLRLSSLPFASLIPAMLFALRGLGALLFGFSGRWRAGAICIYLGNIGLAWLNPAAFATPELPYLNVALLLLAVTPNSRRGLRLAQTFAWLSFAASFLLIAWEKALDTQGSWITGNALSQILTDHFLRAPWSEVVYSTLPVWFWKLGTWAFLASQALAFPALLSRSGRLAWWFLSFGLHAVAGLLLAIPQVSLGLCLAMAFLYPLATGEGSWQTALGFRERKENDHVLCAKRPEDFA